MNERHSFSAFKHANYRIFFFGSGVSLIGAWMQQVAESWLVYEITQSPAALGVIRFLTTIPVTALTLSAGILADKWSKRTILICTQSAAMLTATGLFLLVITDQAAMWNIGILAFILGMANAFDIPSRQSFIVELVGKKDLMNAIALNSTLFHGARALGPAIAAGMIAWVGMAACFLINAVSFLPIIWAYSRMKLPDRGEILHQDGKPRPGLNEAVRIILSNPEMRITILLVSTMSLFGTSALVLAPVFAREALGLDAGGYGTLMAANGLGAFIGAIGLATWGRLIQNRFRWILNAPVLFCLFNIAFAQSENPAGSFVAMLGSGVCMIIFFTNANTLIQSYSPDEFRGRIMGIYSFCFIGVAPFGGWMMGSAAEGMGASKAVTIGGCITITMAIIATLAHGPVEKFDTQES